VNGTTIYLRDVASVSDGFQMQTNIVRQDGRRGVLVSSCINERMVYSAMHEGPQHCVDGERED
jgi:Cu/Ag efflux pump CusA